MSKQSKFLMAAMMFGICHEPAFLKKTDIDEIRDKIANKNLPDIPEPQKRSKAYYKKKLKNKKKK